MKRPLADYVALALIGRVGDPIDIFNGLGDQSFQGSWGDLKAEAEKRCGFPLNEAVLRSAIRTLSTCGLVRISDDRFAGEFIKIYAARFKGFIKSAQEENATADRENDQFGILDRPSDYPNASALLQHPVVEDYAELGDEWLRQALIGIRRNVSEAGSIEEYLSNAAPVDVPASDRIVTFSHNQINELDEKATAVIEGVEALNGIGENPSLRAVVLGQLRAGREFIRAGCVKLFLIQHTLIETLQFLAKRYEKEAIGALASALLAALLNHIGLDI